MIRFIARRLVFGFLVVALVTVATFGLVYAAGDPASASLGRNASPAQVQAFRRRHGLHVPVMTQFTAYLGLTRCNRAYEANDPDRPPPGGGCGMLQGDFGRSFLFGEPVTQVLAVRLPRTLLLGSLALALELLFGLSAGLLAGLRPRRAEDFVVLVGTSVASSVPTMVLGPVAMFTLAYLLGWFPIGGLGGPDLFDQLRHALLPALVLSVGGAASYARLVRSELVEARSSEYVRAARARGLPESKVFLHAARNALVPLVVVVGLSLPGLVGGAIITENVFAWPGLGRLSLEAINALDAPTILAVVWMGAVAVQVGNLAADVAIAVLDPRTRDPRVR